MGDGAAHATLTLARTRSGFFEDGSCVQKKAQPKRYDFDYKGGQALR